MSPRGPPGLAEGRAWLGRSAWDRLRSAPGGQRQGRSRPGLAAPAPRLPSSSRSRVVTSWAPAAAPWRPVAERGVEWTVREVGRKRAWEQLAEHGETHRQTPGNSDQLSRNSAADLPPAPERGSSRPPRPSAAACAWSLGRAQPAEGGRGRARPGGSEHSRTPSGAGGRGRTRPRDREQSRTRAEGWAGPSAAGKRWAGPNAAGWGGRCQALQGLAGKGSVEEVTASSEKEAVLPELEERLSPPKTCSAGGGTLEV